MRYLLSVFIIYLFLGHAAASFSQELPIKPARTISFTTDEGTNMNVDVSPDGKTLVFDLLGDLYSVSANGGNATQLTHGIALHLRPVWSPDGKRIAYISDISGALHLNVMDLAGTFHRVLGTSDKALNYSSDPMWMPDGHYIAIDDFVYGLAGGKISMGINVNHPVGFSPDGQLVYGLDSGRLYSYNQAVKSKAAISPVLKDFHGGSLSPDARWWCYMTDSNSKKCLVAQDLVNNLTRILVPALIEKGSNDNPFMPFPHFSFSPDSRSIFIGYGGKIHRINVESGADQIIPFTAKVKSDLGAYNYHTFRVLHDSVNARYTRSANASPDGRHLVFTAFDKIYVMDLPGGKAHILTPQAIGQFQPVYSPDGQWIAYVSWCDTVGGYLWRVAAAGGRPEQLTHIAGQYQRPAWNPDGTLIAVVKGEPNLGDRDDVGTGRLEVIPVNGGLVRTIDDSVPLWNRLAFSPDGRRVIYTPKFREHERFALMPQLVSKGLNENDLNILAVGSDFTFYQQKIVSPDGRFIVYSADEDLYLVPVCKLTEPWVISDGRQQLSVIRFAPGVDPYWEKDGKVLSWSYGNRFYRINPDKIMAAVEKKACEKGTATENDFIRVSVSPDEVISLNVTVPSLYAHGVIVLRGVRIITMRGDNVIEHGTIVMRDGRITAVGPTPAVRVPAGAKVLDLLGTTVMPGLVDLHLHMRVPSNIFPQQSWMYLVNLAYGVTTARDPSSSFDSFGYGELLESGQMIGPRLYTVGRAVRLTDGVIRVDNLEDAKAVVHKRSLLGGVIIKQYTLPTRIQREWLLIACNEAGLNMTNEGHPNFMHELGMIKDGSTGVEHNPDWPDVYKDVVSFVAASDTYLTPTLQIGYAKEAKPYFNYRYWHYPDPKLLRFTYSDPAGSTTGNGAESLEVITNIKTKDTTDAGFKYAATVDAWIRKYGGRVTLGSHGNDEGIGAHNELWALQLGGLTNMQALQAATIMGAEALGIQKDVGSIEVGKIADLIILNKNPLDDIHNSREIRYVMKDGILYDGNTLDILWPFYKKCPEWKLKPTTGY